jgi:hypothetical protein
MVGAGCASSTAAVKDDATLKDDAASEDAAAENAAKDRDRNACLKMCEIAGDAEGKSDEVAACKASCR